MSLIVGPSKQENASIIKEKYKGCAVNLQHSLYFQNGKWLYFKGGL